MQYSKKDYSNLPKKTVSIKKARTVCKRFCNVLLISGLMDRINGKNFYKSYYC